MRVFTCPSSRLFTVFVPNSAVGTSFRANNWETLDFDKEYMNMRHEIMRSESVFGPLLRDNSNPGIQLH